MTGPFQEVCCLQAPQTFCGYAATALTWPGLGAEDGSIEPELWQAAAMYGAGNSRKLSLDAKYIQPPLIPTIAVAVRMNHHNVEPVSGRPPILPPAMRYAAHHPTCDGGLQCCMQAVS